MPLSRTLSVEEREEQAKRNEEGARDGERVSSLREKHGRTGGFDRRLAAGEARPHYEVGDDETSEVQVAR